MKLDILKRRDHFLYQRRRQDTEGSLVLKVLLKLSYCQLKNCLIFIKYSLNTIFLVSFLSKTNHVVFFYHCSYLHPSNTPNIFNKINPFKETICRYSCDFVLLWSCCHFEVPEDPKVLKNTMKILKWGYSRLYLAINASQIACLLSTYLCKNLYIFLLSIIYLCIYLSSVNQSTNHLYFLNFYETLGSCDWSGTCY